MGSFTIAHYHLDPEDLPTVESTTYDASPGIHKAYASLAIDGLVVFFETAAQAAAVRAELGKIETHLAAASKHTMNWPEDLRGRRVRRVGMEQLAGIIVDRAGTLGNTHAWVAWGYDDEPRLVREALEDLELIPEPASRPDKA